jgi:hypothetical protein
MWYHDETIFYANDRHKVYWYHKDDSAKPYTKGEGPSFMVADFFSPDFGWLIAIDGHSARQCMKPGKNKDGCMTNDDILDQAMDTIDIMEELYPDCEHVIVYDNATTHLKRAEGALSTRKMPKNIPKTLETNFGVEILERNSDGKPVYEIDPNGSPVCKKIKIPMMNGSFADGTPQSFYFTDGPHAGKFEGMFNILTERGHLIHPTKTLAQCTGFKCAAPAIDCCCRHIIYNELDFVNVASALETLSKSQGVGVLFLPKFHCKLNPIEHIWGYAKHLYHLQPPSSREDALEKNVLGVLDSVPLECMRRQVFCSLYF